MEERGLGMQSRGAKKSKVKDPQKVATLLPIKKVAINSLKSHESQVLTG